MGASLCNFGGGTRGKRGRCRRVFLQRVWHCSSPPRPVIWLGPSCHLCATVARPSLAGYRLEPPSPAPARPANRISSRRHCIPATLKRIRFSRCENDAFLPHALPPRNDRPRSIARCHTGPTDPLITHLPHFHSASDALTDIFKIVFWYSGHWTHTIVGIAITILFFKLAWLLVCYWFSIAPSYRKLFCMIIS